MAYENLQLAHPNFCIGPQSGTFCSINQSSVQTTLEVKNDTGALITTFTLSSSILSTLVGFEYVGPRNLTSILNGLTFFTAERVSSSSMIIKRWETYVPNLTLNLKQQIVKSSTGNYRYDSLSTSFEYYSRSFSNHNQGGINYLDMANVSKVVPGTRLFLGPSTDADNIGATETAIVNYVSGNRVYLVSNLTYQYLIGDAITFYNKAYVFSNLGYNGDVTKGSLFQLNALTGSIDNVLFDGLYRKISTSKWCPYMGSIGAAADNNLIFINPYNYFNNIRSLNMNNLEDDKITTIPIKDIVFSDTAMYKLMRKINLRSDSGSETTTSWSSYNYQADTLLPYTNCVHLYGTRTRAIGGNDTLTINVKVIDQFGVGLLGVAVLVSRVDGDTLSEFDPLDGQITTDANGEATIDYISGMAYTGITNIKARASGGSPNTGSQYVWEQLSIVSTISESDDLHVYQQYASGTFSMFAYIVKQITNNWLLDKSLFCKTYFTYPGGDWVNPSSYASQVATYLPSLPVGYQDGPVQSFTGWQTPESPGLNNLLSQVPLFSAEGAAKQVTAFESINDRLRQIANASDDLRVSQLKMAHHTNWVDGVAYTDLFTDVSINQFVFVEDSIPIFWSEKNPKGTDIWIRLRPYAFDLNPATLKFYMKEISHDGNTGFMDMESYLSMSTFDAGGGLIGLDITCEPPNEFHHNGVVYVKIEVYDIAPDPNFIWTEYWFGIIPDYKFPYLDNLNPSREQDNVSVDSDIYFEIKDEGTGVDMSTFEMTVNSVLVSPSITRISDYFYSINYTPPANFSFNKEIIVNVKVADSSSNANYLNNSYRFYTASSSSIWFTDMVPGQCKRGLSPYSSVRFLVLGGGNGVDRDTIRVQILERDKTSESSVVPVIYRVS